MGSDISTKQDIKRSILQPEEVSSRDSTMSTGDFQFVTLSHPGDVKSKQQQSLIRGHAIRNSAKKIRNEAEKCQENFVIVEMDLENRRPKKRTRKPKTKVARSPSARLLDPFRTLPGSPERLAMLMRHSESALHRTVHSSS
jgi:hypothetical protein